MKTHIVRLTVKERNYLQAVTKKGTHNTRVITRARILLLTDEGKIDQVIADKLEVSKSTVRARRKRYGARSTIEEAIHDAPRPGKPRVVTPDIETFIIATACTEPPHGHDHWFLEDLRDTVNKTYSLTLKTPKAIRAVLIRSQLKPWREKNVVHAKTDTAVQSLHG